MYERIGMKEKNSARPGTALPSDFAFFHPVHDVLEGFLENVQDVLIVQGIENVPAVPPGADLAVVPENAQLVGDRGLTHVQNVHEIADTAFFLGQGVQNLDPGFIPKDFVEFRHFPNAHFVHF
jgi:hypothetical protein